jgi:hypothetical protein
MRNRFISLIPALAAVVFLFSEGVATAQSDKDKFKQQMNTPLGLKS